MLLHGYCVSKAVNFVSESSIFTLNTVLLEIYKAAYLKALFGSQAGFVEDSERQDPSVIPNVTGQKSLPKTSSLVLASEQQLNVCSVAQKLSESGMANRNQKQIQQIKFY